MGEDMEGRIEKLEQSVADIEDSVSEMRISQQAIHTNVDRWMDKVGTNEAKLVALHTRMDEHEGRITSRLDDHSAALGDLKAEMLTEKSMTTILETSFNAHVVHAVKRFIQTTLALAFAACSAWVLNFFNYKD